MMRHVQNWFETVESKHSNIRVMGRNGGIAIKERILCNFSNQSEYFKYYKTLVS